MDRRKLRSLSFQGRLTDPGGIPSDTPSIGMTFKLYKNGSEIWSETHPAVAVENGVFNVLLGGVTCQQGEMVV